MDRRYAMKTIWVGLLLAGLLVTPARAETVTYLHTDLLGSVVLETDQNRNVVARYEYEPYGLPRQAIADAPGYTGHVHDAGSGLVYMQQRYYDPEVGRFLSVDPVGVDTGTGGNFNRYWYADNNPYANVDPDGRRCVSLNRNSTYCMRRDIYHSFDARVQGSTRFFGAAAMTVEYLANRDIPLIGRLGGSSEAARFLQDVSSELYSLNAATYAAIRDGRMTGPNLDSRLVHMEQNAVQAKLDALPADARSRIVDSINGSFSRRVLASGHPADQRYNNILDRVETSLGRDIDFGIQSDREAIGNAIIRDIRRSGGCSATGTRIKSC